jgi:hypothetical protein
VIHYHGTPLTPREKLLTLAGKHFCVSFAEPRDAAVCLQIGQSVMWDNGAFSAFTRGHKPDWNAYYDWLEDKLSPPHWAVVPDVIDGSVEDQRAIVADWPHGKLLGTPVWHMGLPIDYLLELTDHWPRVCFGSTAQYWQVGSETWERRCDQAFNALERHRRFIPWVHMLRGLSLAGKRWPFASADSVNVARNFKCAGRDPEIMAREIDGVQCPGSWEQRPEQMEMCA